MPWKTGATLDWFKGITQKSRKRFLQMDIVEFYPSITEELLNKALDWASTVADEPVSQESRDIIRHARKALLFSKPTSGSTSIPWVKKDGLFDVTMGAPDGAEVCELVGLFLLKEVRDKFPDLDYGLYRDDGLANHRRIGGKKLDEIRKGLQQLFRSHGLRITIEPPNLTIVNFLDVKLSLETGTFCPYRKPNDEPKYVNAKSNHPPRRASTLSQKSSGRSLGGPLHVERGAVAVICVSRRNFSSRTISTTPPT